MGNKNLITCITVADGARFQDERTGETRSGLASDEPSKVLVLHFAKVFDLLDCNCFGTPTVLNRITSIHGVTTRGCGLGVRYVSDQGGG